MKKISIIILVTLAFTINIGFAQDRENETDLRRKLLFGLKAGANLSNVYNESGEDFVADAKLGFVGGAFIAIPIGKYFGVQPEALYSQKGFSGRGTILDGKYNFTRTTHYLDVPLMFSVKPGEFLTLLVGPQYSYLFNQTDVFQNATTSIAQEQEFENDDIRKNTLSAIVGVDLTLKHFVVSARAAWDIQNNNGNGTSTTPQYKNAWYQLTLGYRFYRERND
jgi:hypothetical protein